jgi:hypothetical protein
MRNSATLSNSGIFSADQGNLTDEQRSCSGIFLSQDSLAAFFAGATCGICVVDTEITEKSRNGRRLFRIFVLVPTGDPGLSGGGAG